MPRLVIQLLGPFLVKKDDQPVVFPYDKLRALLAYLAVETGSPLKADSPVSRARLASLLWPDQPQSAAQDSLRQALSRLRALTGDRDTQPPFLLVERDTVQINPAGRVQIDLAAFHETLARVSAHHHRSLPACTSCAALLEKAGGLLRGDFLEDLLLPDSDLFETWATTLREQIKIQALDLFRNLGQFYERRGAPERTLAYAAHQIQIDPYHEPAHRQMMQALVRSGQRSQAVLHFNHLEQMLADELGILPSSETLELFAAIREGKNLPSPSTGQVRNLPVPLSPLVGRTVELSELNVWLSDPDRRLISLTGPGGVGKTRLVIQAAHGAAGMFSGGVAFVPLIRMGGGAAPAGPETAAAYGASSALAGAIASAFGASSGVAGDTGASSTGASDKGASDRDAAWAQVSAALQKQELLLVLDGFEYVLNERMRVAELLEAHAGLVILVTTRQRLDLPGEWVFGLGGLEIPPAHMNRQLEAYSAVNLFCQCAQQVNHSFALNDTNRQSIAEICQLVDGLPLAIRLAAAWTRSLSCAEIAAEIRRGLDILSGQLPPEAEESQSSVRAVFEQSWNRLEPAERDVFARLSVFRGGFDRGAAEQVAGASIAVLTRLVDQSLLRMSPEGRYDLHDLLSQFGAEKLRQAGAEADALRRHFDWYYTQAEQNERMLHGAHALKAFIWLVREAANLREALAWGHAHAPEQADRLAGWMHAEFHQMGVHVLEREKKERT